MSEYKRISYPFAAVTGQEKMKKALILNAINPEIGGVLIEGEKGTGKSTVVRALLDILPYEDINFINLPLSVTEDRLVGTVDLEHAIKYGKCRFEPGLLYKAHRGIVYVDEINLLEDHISDILLDTAASGINTVEREGISYSHESSFILIGTMNPEEGQLRPQIADRFALSVHVEGEKDPYKRMEIIKRRESFDNNKEVFIKEWEDKQQQLKSRIVEARKLLKEVNISEKMLSLIAKLSLEASVAGHRADIAMEKTASAIAALNNRREVLEEDVYEAADFVLNHRRRNKSETEKQQKNRDKSNNENSSSNKNKGNSGKNEERNEPESRSGNSDNTNEEAAGNKEEVFAVGETFKVRKLSSDKDRIIRYGKGRRSRTRTESKNGRYVRSTESKVNSDIALDATIRAAAPYQLRRRKADSPAIVIKDNDIRRKIREKQMGNLIVFVVDASGSMGAGKRMIETKGAVMSLLTDAYEKRDKVAMISFKGDSAEVLLPPTGSVERAEKLLCNMPTGGKTPLSAAIKKAYNLCENELYKDKGIAPLLIFISDGRGNVSLSGKKPKEEMKILAETIRDDERIKTLVVDVEKKGPVSFNLAKELSGSLGSQYYKIEDLKSESLLNAVRRNRNA